MFVLVTGGGGFLGRYIVEQLLARGDRVRNFARGAYPELAALGVETVQGDLRDASAVRDAAKGIDAVFHVAALPGIWGSWKTFHDINTLGTQNIIAACQSHGVQRLIFTSSPSVVYDGQPHVNADESLPYPAKYLCHYPHTKALAEQAVLAANSLQGLRTVALRPHLIWGPRDPHLIPRLLQRAATGKLMQVGPGENEVSVAYVENAATAHLLADRALSEGTTAAGRAYFINEPQPVNLWGWINELLAIAGLPPVKRRISAGFAKAIGSTLEVVHTLVPALGEPRMTRFLASQLSQSHSYSIARAQQDLGDFTRVSFADAMLRVNPQLRELGQRLRTR